MSHSRRLAAAALSVLAPARLFASGAVAKNPPTTGNPPGPH
jgi:hypothetical protein